MEATTLTHSMRITFPEKIISQCIDGYGNNLYVHDSTNSLISYSLKTNTISGRYPLPNDTQRVIVAPTSHYIAIICIKIGHIYSLPTMKYIGSVPNLIDFEWSNDAFLESQRFLALCEDNLKCFQISLQNENEREHENDHENENKNEIIEEINSVKLFGKKVLVNNQYSIACVYTDKEIYTFSPTLADKENITKYPLAQPLSDACFCKRELFILCGAILTSADKKKKIHLPLRGSEFKVVSHFTSIIAYDANKIFIIEPEKLSIQSVVETKSFEIQNLQTNTRLSLLSFIVPTTVTIGLICSDEYTTENGFLRVFEQNSVKIHTKFSVLTLKRNLMGEGTGKSGNSAPSSEHSIFIGKTTGLTEHEITEVFEKTYGPVVKVRLHTGYGFVDFKEARSKEKALANQNLKVKDKLVTISVAVGSSSRKKN